MPSEMNNQSSDLRWFVHEMGELWASAKKTWAIVSPFHRWMLASASLMMAANSLSSTYQALLLGRLVDRIHDGAGKFDVKTLYGQALAILGTIAVLTVIREVFNVLRRFTVENTCTGLNRDMQLRVIRHVLQYDLAQLQMERVGTLHGKIFRSVDGLVTFVRLMFLDFLPIILTGLFAASAAIMKNVLLGCLMLAVAPISIFLTLRQLKSQKGVRLQLMRDCEDVDGMLVEQLGGVESIRVSNTINFEMDRMSVLTKRRRDRELKHHFEMSLFGSGKALNEAIFHLAVLALATYLAIEQKISFGDILTFSALFASVMGPLNEIHRVVDLGHESSLRMSDLQYLLSRPIDVSFEASGTAAGGLISTAKGATIPAVELIDVTSTYRTSDGVERRALRGISLKIFPGESIGIAGPSGGGKSTLIKVLLRLVHPTSGQVLLNGVDLASISRDELAAMIGYVGQVPFVFSGTISQNIAYGTNDMSESDIQRAAVDANLDHDVQLMPDHYQTVLAERGSNLSGGQKQRIAIARMLARQSPLLIMDEATSALDNISERTIQDALRARSGEQTIIMIAHRLSTLRHCDRILVIDGGRIAEHGTYNELKDRNGLFARLLEASESGHGKH